MNLSQRMELRQGQSLVMTPQLLQAIKLLQLSHLDLAAYVDAELERNPLLEREEDGETPARDTQAEDATPSPTGDDEPEAWRSSDLTQDRASIERDLDTSLENVFQSENPAPAREASGGDELALSQGLWSGVGAGGSFDDDGGFESSLTREPTLREHLAAQLDLATADPRERLIGSFVIDAIDDAGYLSESVEDIADRVSAPSYQVEAVLRLVQGFDPSGVGARDLAECLAIQLRERDRFDPCMQSLVGRLDLLAKRDLAALKRLCGVDDEDLVQMIAEIRALDPKPGRAFGGSPAEILIPDVFVRAAPDGSWIIDLNPQTLPRVLMNQSYFARVSRSARSAEEKAYVAECFQNANWLTRSLDQRARTIVKVASEIVRQQDGFFAHGVAHLRPLNLKTIADAIGMHESTVSRVTSNKAIGTSRGVFEMKYFFTASIPGAGGEEAHSAEAVRHRIKQLIDQETVDSVLSDDALVKKLREQGIDIARRTIAKYRESLRIPSSVERRRQKGG
ncbi:MAG: RNA polymerase sigma-54 factor [Salinarimonadaceae bacterium]|nr:MAG: RNA polymerase sigma-54 factor [Salinarimonadaceae bacterium]